MDVISTVNPEKCLGITKADLRCQRKRLDGLEYCGAHCPDNQRCSAITREGKTCTRNVWNGNVLCTIHKRMSERSPRKIQPKIRKPRGKANPKARKVKKPSRVDESKKNEVIELPKRTGNGKKCHLINHSQNPMGLIDSLEIVDDLNELTECLHQRSTLMIPLTNEETMHCARIILNTDQDDYSHLGIIKAAMMFIKMTTKI